MRIAGVRGVRKSQRVFTTKSDPELQQPADLVNRRFTADGPRRLWVCDVTYVATWSGFAYVAFVTDAYSRRIVGWNVAATLRAEVLPMQALDMAAWNAGDNLTGLTHHSDHGSNYMAMVYTDRIVELADRSLPPERSATASITQWPRPSTTSTRRNCSGNVAPGGPLSRSSSRRSNECGGGTTSASMANSTCAPHSRSRPRTTLTSNQPTRHLPDKPHHRNENQADSGRRSGIVTVAVRRGSGCGHLVMTPLMLDRFGEFTLDELAAECRRV